ncbi:hypothetical protein CRYUN_Cryun27aG0103400 [Craigia yunnanensis]
MESLRHIKNLPNSTTLQPPSSAPPVNGPSASSPTSNFSLPSATLSPPLPPQLPLSLLRTPRVHIVDFYKVLGAETQFLGDGIKRAYEARISKPPQYGFSQDTLISRIQILQAACETLDNPDSRRNYNQGLVMMSVTLSSLKSPGTRALAYVDLSRDAMALNPPDFIGGCEVLERALKLFQEEGASCLAPDLQSQIDETLEEITPRCVMELLALPLDDEYWTKREEGLHENFQVYGVALALVAQAFLSKKPHLIRDADNLFQQLQQTKVTTLGNPVLLYTPVENCEKDFALERGLCSLIVGELDECRSWLGLDSGSSPYRNRSIVDFVLENSKDDDDDGDLPGLCKLLEAWLMEGVSGSPLAAAAAILRIGAEATAVLDHVKASAIQALQKVETLGKPDQEDYAILAEIPGISSLEEMYEEETITDRIKDASVKIMFAGVVIGLMTFVGLKFLPG